MWEHWSPHAHCMPSTHAQPNTHTTKYFSVWFVSFHSCLVLFAKFTSGLSSQVANWNGEDTKCCCCCCCDRVYSHSIKEATLNATKNKTISFVCVCVCVKKKSVNSSFDLTHSMCFHPFSSALSVSFSRGLSSLGFIFCFVWARACVSVCPSVSCVVQNLYIKLSKTSTSKQNEITVLHSALSLEKEFYVRTTTYTRIQTWNEINRFSFVSLSIFISLSLWFILAGESNWGSVEAQPINWMRPNVVGQENVFVFLLFASLLEQRTHTKQNKIMKFMCETAIQSNVYGSK